MKIIPEAEIELSHRLVGNLQTAEIKRKQKREEKMEEKQRNDADEEIEDETEVAKKEEKEKKKEYTKLKKNQQKTIHEMQIELNHRLVAAHLQISEIKSKEKREEGKEEE